MGDNNTTDAENAEGISDSDIYQAMEEMSGYVDITLEDFREIYRHAYQHAHKKVSLAIAEKRTGCRHASQQTEPPAARQTSGQLLKTILLRCRALSTARPVSV